VTVDLRAYYLDEVERILGVLALMLAGPAPPDAPPTA